MEGLLQLCNIFLKTCDYVFAQLARNKTLEIDKKINLDDQLNKLLLSCQKDF